MLSRAEEQKKEIETIKERQIFIKLSDADCERISKLCGAHNLTVGELLENFIGDLVCGTYTNGSDEEEIEYLKTDMADWEQELAELKETFRKKNEKADWEEEVKKVKLWFEEMERMRDE